MKAAEPSLARTRIAVVGCGAIGSSVGADLHRAGYDVTMIDYWPAHIDAIRQNGLLIKMPDEEIQAQPPVFHMCDLASETGLFDLVLLATKSNDHRWAAEFIKPRMRSTAHLVGLQNGMNDDSIAEVIGRDRTLGCVVELSAEIFNPGIVKRNTPPSRTWFAVGELNGAESERLNDLAHILSSAGSVARTTNIYGSKWSKLIANSMTMGPFGLLGLNNSEAPDVPGMFDLSVRLGTESLAVGTALGYQIEPLFGLDHHEFVGSDEEKIVLAMRTLLSHIGRGRTAPIHDHIKGRESEIRFISGVVSQRGRELGIPTPANDAVVELDRQINEGSLAMDPSNFALLVGMVSGRQTQ